MGGGDIDAGSISPPASLDVREKNDDVARPTGFLYVPQSRVVDSRVFFSRSPPWSATKSHASIPSDGDLL